jgi:membrane fusion protein (multidrug efflux system)
MSQQSNDTSATSILTRRLPLFIILALLISLIGYLQWPESRQSDKTSARSVSVKMTEVSQVDFIESVEAVGTARANEQVVITSKYSDIVEAVYFDDGQQVKKGDILVELNDREEVAKVDELLANLAESKAQLKRLSELFASRATSASVVEEQQAKTKSIEAQLVSAGEKVNDLVIRAPFTGVLGFREVSKGAYVNAGSHITNLDDVSMIKVDFHLPERLLTHINVGQRVSAVNTAYKDKTFIGKITAIDSRVDSTTRTIKVRAIINNDSLKLHPGMLLNIIVLLDVETILQLPESTIIPIENKHYVFIEVNGKAVRKTIQIGRRHLGLVEVVSGLIVGEKVVVEGALKLRDGVGIDIINLLPNELPFETNKLSHTDGNQES